MQWSEKVKHRARQLAQHLTALVARFPPPPFGSQSPAIPVPGDLVLSSNLQGIRYGHGTDIHTQVKHSYI